MKRTFRIFLVALAGIAITACSDHSANTSEHAAKTAERAVSPLVGTWTRDGDVPKPDPKSPQFTELRFTPDGSLGANYVSAGGALAGVINKAPKIQREQDTYSTPEPNTLRIAEGSSYREYQFRITDGKLFLTPSGGGEAAVFSKSGDAS